MGILDRFRLKPKNSDGLRPPTDTAVAAVVPRRADRLGRWIVVGALVALAGVGGVAKTGLADSAPREGVRRDEPASPRSVPRDSLPADLFDLPIPLGLLEVARAGDGNAADPERGADERARARFDLGRALFFDPQLSLDRTVACATCHRPEHGFASPDPRPVGVQGKTGKRHAPTLFNRGFGRYQSWDGRATTLEEQALVPIEDPLEMGLSMDDALRRMRADEVRRVQFSLAFEDGVSEENLGIALADFMRRLYSGGSRVDRFVNAQEAALTPEEKAGLWLYESKGRCWMCHSGRNYTDESFHNTGVGVRDGQPEEGRFAITGLERDRGAFKTPTLRGVALHPPYMHDGSLATLREVVEFYRRGGHPNDRLDRNLRPLDLSDRDVDHLVAFLEALSER